MNQNQLKYILAVDMNNLVHEHLGADWKIIYASPTVCKEACESKPKFKIIWINKYFFDNCNHYATVKDVLLHEIARNLVGHGKEHYNDWYETSRNIGGSGYDVRTEENKQVLKKMARKLIAKHLSRNWKFEVKDLGGKAHGNCCCTDHIISIDEELFGRASQEIILDAVLHEIAHAITEHDHDKVWKDKYIELGGSGTYYLDASFDENGFYECRQIKRKIQKSNVMKVA